MIGDEMVGDVNSTVKRANCSTRSYLRRTVAEREHARRRVVLGGIGALTLLGTVPIVGHHVAIGASSIWQGTDYLGALCLVGLRAMLIPVHETFHLLLGIGLLYASIDRGRAWWRMHRVLAGLETRLPEPHEPVWSAAKAAGLPVELVRVVDGLPNPAFTAGWLRPRVYVACALSARLSQAELAAVLAHESAHVARRDPLRLSLLRVFACVLFWIPALRRLADDIADEAEVHADDVAARLDPLVLANAILRVAAWRMEGAQPESQLAAVGFACRDMVERRIRRLAGEDINPTTHVTRRSFAAALLVLLLVWTSGAMAAQPVSNVPHEAEHDRRMAMPANCTHYTGPAILHVFCPGFAVGSLYLHCPHDGRPTSRT